jgi:hypothetical protein
MPQSRLRRIFSFSALAPAFICLALMAPTAKAEGLDPGVIDPVGKLSRISASVSNSSKELEDISQALEKLNDELSKSEKATSAKITKAQLDVLQKRFQSTIDRSYIVEKEVKDSLAKDQRDIENVRVVLREIQKERQVKAVPKAGPGAANRPRRPVMTDGEIAECLKDLDDLSTTIKGLQQSLVDDQKPAQNKTAGSLPRGHSVKGR